MLRYILGRVLAMIPTLFVVSIFIFIIIQLPPGDFLTTLESQLAAQGDGADLTYLENLRSRYALDQPLTFQYFSWIWGFTGALLSVPILLTITALVDHLGRPNLIGFVFGEPLFHANVLDLGDEG